MAEVEGHIPKPSDPPPTPKGWVGSGSCPAVVGVQLLFFGARGPSKVRFLLERYCKNREIAFSVRGPHSNIFVGDLGTILGSFWGSKAIKNQSQIYSEKRNKKRG